MTLASRVLLVLVVFFMAAPAFADTTPVMSKEDMIAVGKAQANPALGAGIGMGLAVLGAGVGIGLIGFAALSGIARQPEQAGKIQGAMYVLAGLVEGAAILALLLGFVVAARIMGS